jgi:hypothetical protein
MIQDIKSITSGSLNSNGLEDPFNSLGSNEEEKERLLNERQLVLDEKRLLLSREELRKSDLLIKAMDSLTLNLRDVFGNAPSPTPTNNRTNTNSSVSSNVSNTNISNTSQSNGMMKSVSNRFNSYKTDTINQARRVEPTVGLSGMIATRYKPSNMTANISGTNSVKNTSSGVSPSEYKKSFIENTREGQELSTRDINNNVENFKINNPGAIAEQITEARSTGSKDNTVIKNTDRLLMNRAARRQSVSEGRQKQGAKDNQAISSIIELGKTNNIFSNSDNTNSSNTAGNVSNTNSSNTAGNVSNTNSSNTAGNVSNTNSSNTAGNVSNTNINNLSDIGEQQLAELKKIVSAGIISHKVQEETSDNIDKLVKSDNLAELHAEEIRLEKNNGVGFQIAANSNNTNMGSGVTGSAVPSGSILSALTDITPIAPSPLGAGKNAPSPPGASGGSRLSRGLGVLKAGVLARAPTLLRGVSGGIGGLLGGMALNAGGDALEEAGHEKLGAGARIGAKAVSYAGMGAMLGSVVPGVGTAIGAGLGGVAGGAMGFYENFETLMGTKGEENKELTETIKSNTIAVEDAKEQTKTEAPTNIVNAPVSTVNNTTSVNSRTSIRNQDPFIIQSLRYNMI